MEIYHFKLIDEDEDREIACCNCANNATLFINFGGLIKLFCASCGYKLGKLLVNC